MTSALPDLHERRRKAEELFARWREGCARLVSKENRPPELVLKRTDARAHGRLSDIQPLGGADEAARLNDGQECPCEFNVHVSTFHPPRAERGWTVDHRR
jgi:hypothetical protein